MNYKQTFLQALMIFCKERNLDLDRIAPSFHFDLTNQQVEALWKNIVYLSHDELAGLHFGSTMQIAALNVVGQIIQTSSTVKDALLQARSLIHLFTDLYTMEIEENTKTFTILFRSNESFDQFPVTRDQMGDFLTAFTLYELNGLLLAQPKPVKIGLPTYKKSFDTEYTALFKCQAKKTAHYLLEFPKEFLQTPVITANYEIQTLLLNHINKMQSPASLPGDFSKRIFNYLLANSYVYSQPIEAVAGNFSISVRTLQRKLKEEGVSFLHIVEEVRKSLAIHYIQNRNSSVKEISQFLGYAEPSGFVRAFKKWTGQTPTSYRNNGSL
jgi:AraC-like DNA-binding protein